MATLFIDYQQLVMRAYERKKVNNELPHGLVEPAPARLKEECTKRCTQALTRRDERVIRDFCGDLNESKSCYVLLERCETDKFKPLVNYLKGKSENTDRKNIELLAWLIDFSGRPWEIGKSYSNDDDINEEPAPNGIGPATRELLTASDDPANPPAAGSDKPDLEPVIPGNPIILTEIESLKGKESAGVITAETGEQKKLKVKSTKRLTVAIMLSLALGTGSMWWWNRTAAPGGNCMYWHEDHYEAIACDQKVPNAMVIALDTIRLKNFRKLTRPDTITYKAIGRVWYSKIGGKLEYYTSGGEHPVIFGRQLKPITVYIIDKYILSGMITK